MITITEGLASKLPGDKSLYISFDYRQELVDIIKNIKNRDFAYWSKKDLKWEIPISSLSEFIDNACYFDDISINLLTNEEDSCIIKSATDHKSKPYDYQLEGIEYGLNHDKWLLLDMPGLGKSLQAIYLAEELKAQKNIEHCLIICGVNTLKSNWKNEISKHSKLDSIIIGEKISSTGKTSYMSVPERAEQLMNTIDQFFIIINIESIRDDSVVDAILNGPNNIDLIVFDEMHKAKSNKTQQASNLLKLKSTYQVGMSGTMIMNDPLDSYVPLTWIDANRCSLTNFKSYFCILGGPTGYQVVGLKNSQVLKDLISDYSLRRTTEVLKDLPSKNLFVEYVDMDDQHRKFYNSIKDGVKEEADKVDLKPTNILAMTQRLRQATACPSVLTSQSVTSSKLDRAYDLVNEIVSQGEKVVVFSTFKESVYILADMLKEYNPIIATGDNKDYEINDAVVQFQNDPTRKVFIATWQKMGTGLTLTAASYMIHIDTAWNDALFEQTCDRIYRIGATKPVFIYTLVCKDTIDERVLSLVESKGAMSDYLIDDKLSEKTVDSLRKYIQEL